MYSLRRHYPSQVQRVFSQPRVAKHPGSMSGQPVTPESICQDDAVPVVLPGVGRYTRSVMDVLVLLAAGFYVGWNIGANDAANCIGTTVGAGLISMRKAIAMMAVLVVLGGVLQGHTVMKTVGKGIVITTPEAYLEVHGQAPPAEMDTLFPGGRMPDMGIFVALVSAGLFVTLATFSRVPVSTSQAIVGGVAGVGIGVVGFQPDYLDLSVLLRIVVCWVLTPVLTLVLAALLYRALIRLLRHAHSLYWTRVLGVLALASAGYVSFSLGANDVGNAIGPLLQKFPSHGVALALLGGAAMAVGAMTLGSRVVQTVGRDIAQLDLAGAFAAQITAAGAVHFFSILGIPTSTSQAIVGAVIGVGLTHGTRTVGLKKVGTIVAGWVLTPTCAALFAMTVYRLLRWLLA